MLYLAKKKKILLFLLASFLNVKSKKRKGAFYKLLKEQFTKTQTSHFPSHDNLKYNVKVNLFCSVYLTIPEHTAFSFKKSYMSDRLLCMNTAFPSLQIAVRVIMSF